MADLVAIHTNNRLLRTIYPVKVSRVILSVTEHQQTCPNHRHFLLLLLAL